MLNINLQSTKKYDYFPPEQLPSLDSKPLYSFGLFVFWWSDLYVSGYLDTRRHEKITITNLKTNRSVELELSRENLYTQSRHYYVNEDARIACKILKAEPKWTNRKYYV